MEPWLEVSVSDEILDLLLKFLELSEKEQGAVLERISHGDDN